jgi:hypothetical protein
MAASRPGGGVMAISVQFRPMPDREWTYSCWVLADAPPRPAGDPRPPIPPAALLVGFVRRTPAGRWIARARCQIAQPMMSEFADRVGAAKRILLAGGYARHPATQTRRIAA